MEPNEKDRAALLQAMLGSEVFAKPEHSKALLRALFEWYPVKNGVKGNVLFAVAHGEKGTVFIPDTLYQQVFALNRHIRKYFESEDAIQQKWICSLPDGSGKGYRLEFSRNPAASLSPTERFWQAHYESKLETFVVCNELMFFQDLKEDSVIRFFDVNPEHTRSKDDKRAELRRLHSKAYKSHLEPVYVYLVNGEVQAADALNNWFAANTGVPAARRTCHGTDESQILSSSPILLGSTRTNRFMGAFLSDTTHFGYHFTDQFGVAKILDLTKPEQENLAAFKPEPDEDGDVTIQKRSSAKGEALGFVFRFPNPAGGRGAVTMIASDYTPVMKQIALALADDTLAAEIVRPIPHIDGKLPPSFELLISVALEPGNLEYQVGQPRLVGCRAYSKTFKRIRGGLELSSPKHS